MAREHLIDTARQVYRSYGFAPIDTPALEYAEVLLGKGGEESDKQVFRFTDQGDRDVAMRFDLTVPLARYSAQHIQELGTPFRRYHIGPVWRGERPARGRYREFMQCDFDTIGSDSNATDIETLMVIHDLFEKIGIERFTIRVNNRRVLNGLLEKNDLLQHASGILRALDKLDKIGRDKVVAEMVEQVGISEAQAGNVLDMAMLTGTPDEILTSLDGMLQGSETGETGLSNLQELFGTIRTCGLPQDRVTLDVSIARGLNYYTGTIYETFLGDLPGIGSVCSGGRYDNLAQLFTSQKLPGVGASLGVDRMLAAMEELGMTEKATTPAPVLVTMFERERAADYMQIARTLRQAGIGAEVFPEAKGIGKQMKYANRKGFQVALIAGTDEFASGTWQVKGLVDGSQQQVATEQVVATIEALIR
ncbi:Histidine--tRNA ligase [Fuerstiella marisgermanici]|uniref:Histidine--tRNA ligase n=2 Tax=Fuerstiella marisgermanici TaxID=1891926 RepID=A0A1P8WLA7_9PLAN|nr:Histidine--tRNA ligase [Fuerstiella marisgermanici]